MKKLRNIVLILLALVLLIGASLFVTGVFKPTGAGIFIETDPVSAVYINGEQVGRTPYKETRDPGEITLKLIPESFQTPLAHECLCLVGGHVEKAFSLLGNDLLCPLHDVLTSIAVLGKRDLPAQLFHVPCI
jgi:hypothetical protein